jgi:hypothetical protein
MSTTHTIQKPALSQRAGAALAAVGAVIAVGIAVLFLSVGGANRVNRTVVPPQTTTYYPLIQYHGTGQGPAPSPSALPGWRYGEHS